MLLIAHKDLVEAIVDPFVTAKRPHFAIAISIRSISYKQMGEVSDIVFSNIADF